MVDNNKPVDTEVPVAEEDRTGSNGIIDSVGVGLEEQWWTEDKEFEHWLEAEPSTEFDSEELFFFSVPPLDGRFRRRLELIKESYSLLRQFSAHELKVLMTLKRSASPKSWTLREDLVILTLSLSNREIAQFLEDRNKEAVKKRLQLLKSKGLAKRMTEDVVPEVLE